MLSKKFFDELSDKFSDTISATPIKDMENNIKAMLSSVFTKMDLVTREEFEIQQQILLKTRQKVRELETKISALESQMAQTASTDNLSEDSINNDPNLPA